MKALAFAGRNGREMLRDKLTLIFGLGFPLGLMLLFWLIQSNIPLPLFEMWSLTPGLAVFGFSFISLFTGLVISKDRCSSFMLRLRTSPMTAGDFLLGYSLPLLPMALGQMLVCFAAALALGLEMRANILLSMAVIFPAALVFIALGLICGSLFTDKQVGGVCGAALTNVSALLSGAWFDVSMVGGVFEDIAMVLPFARAVEAGRAALAGDYAAIVPNLLWVLAWAAALMVIAIPVFHTRITSDGK